MPEAPLDLHRSMGVCIFAMVAGFFPLDEAASSDWRFFRLLAAQANGGSTCEAIFSLYRRSCPFSADLVSLLDGMLTIAPTSRSTLEIVCTSLWLRPVGGIPTGEACPWALPAMIQGGRGSWASTAMGTGDEDLSDETDRAGDEALAESGEKTGDEAGHENGDDTGRGPSRRAPGGAARREGGSQGAGGGVWGTRKGGGVGEEWRQAPRGSPRVDRWAA
eukprot:scaffold27400_cov140-Isochrysis_galbana.AAC.3